MRNLSILLLLPVMLFGQWQGWNTHQKYKGWEKSETAEVDTTTYLFDRYTDPAIAAYSLRLLDSDYADSVCITIRRSSDDATQDIGFVGGEWDSISALAFVGAGDGFVTTWHDQSGNGNNITQTTAANQPIVISSGAILYINSDVYVGFEADDFLLSTLPGFESGPAASWAFVISTPVEAQADAATMTLFSYTESSNVYGFSSTTGIISGEKIIKALTTPTQFRYGSTTYARAANADQLLFGVDKTTNKTEVWANSNSIVFDLGSMPFDGTPASLGLSSAALLRVNSYDTGGGAAEKIKEIIIYNSDQSANRTAIEGNINAYYGIY